MDKSQAQYRVWSDCLLRLADYVHSVTAKFVWGVLPVAAGQGNLELPQCGVLLGCIASLYCGMSAAIHRPLANLM